MRSAELQWLAEAVHKVPQLTRREAEIVMLLGLGTDTTRQIAETLRISEYTVKRHMTHIIEKLGVGSRVHVALLGFFMVSVWHQGGMAAAPFSEESRSHGRADAAGQPSTRNGK